jgi:hypothetical protein
VRRIVVGAAVGGLVVAASALVIAQVVPSADAAAEGPPPGAVRAAAFAGQGGARTENTADAGGGRNVGWLGDGDWLRYDAVDLGPAGPLTTSVRMAAAYPDRKGSVEVHLDQAGGPLLATVAVTATGGWQTWTTRTDTRPSPGGLHSLYVLLRSEQPQDFVNLNWYAFSEPGTATAAPATGTATPAPSVQAPAGGWIPVDPAAWNAQLAAFKALTPRAKKPGATNPEFNATCAYSHSGPNDPIVFPGLKGASHMHSFVGNDATDAGTTPGDLMRLTASSCKPIEDHSAYWVPTLYEHGQPQEPKEVVVYYGSLLKDPAQTVPMPNGLRMIAGDAKKQADTPKGAVNQFYCAGGPQDGASRSGDGNWPVCAGGTLHFTLRFPDCWDGRNLDSPNHRDHVSFGQGGACPAAHPVPIPAVTFSIAYAAAGSADGFQLSSGKASSIHGDAFFAWEPDAMAARVKNCVVQTTPCNTAGNA